MEPSAGLAALAADPEPRFVEIAKSQPEYQTLPALVYADGRVLTEWTLSEAERARLVAGEAIRLWIWCHPPRCPHCLQLGEARLQPVALGVTDEHRG